MKGKPNSISDLILPLFLFCICRKFRNQCKENCTKTTNRHHM